MGTQTSTGFRLNQKVDSQSNFFDLPGPNCNILISADASDLAVGGVIWNETTPSPPGNPLIERKVQPITQLGNHPEELYAILLILTESSLANFLKTRHLTIFTDHKNLAYLISCPDKNRMVKRWLFVLSEYQFDIVHTSGVDNHWADMLSRLCPHSSSPSHSDAQLTDDPVATPRIDHTNIPSINSLREVAQRDLPIFSNWLSRIRSEQRKAVESNEPLFINTTFNDRVQLYLTPNKKILIPLSLRKSTLLNIYGLVQSGHPSLSTSIKTLNDSDYWWPNMKDDLTNHIKNCPSCQKTSPIKRDQIPHSGSLWADKPFSKINVDTIGPLSPDADGNRFILVFVDFFTRFTILVPIIDLNAKEAAYALVFNVCGIFGIPYSIHSDNGPEFANATFNAVCQLLAIENSTSIPHFSQSNGLVERRHRDVLRNLQRFLIDFGAFDNWAEYIPFVQLQLNATKNRYTEHTPYELMFGSSFGPKADPSLIIKALEASNLNIPFIEDLQRKNERIKEKQESASSNQSSKRPPKSNKSNPFVIGDLILRSSKTATKLHGKHSGPFLVIEIPSPSSLKIKNLVSGIESQASVHQCKLYNSDLPSNHGIHQQVAAGDKEEHVIIQVLEQFHSHEGLMCSVLWYGGDITTVASSSIKNTKAYVEFMKNNNNPPSSPRKRTSSKAKHSKTPIAKRTRRRRRSSVSI
ncbi:hypothetical protein GEMRC1_007561 [Eukaryota sp. GEM-RC1]